MNSTRDENVVAGWRTLPIKDQVAILNGLTEHIKHHSPAGQTADLELLSSEDFDADSAPSSADDEAADGDTPGSDEGTAVEY